MIYNLKKKEAINKKSPADLITPCHMNQTHGLVI